jgi:hypothetical protein
MPLYFLRPLARFRTTHQHAPTSRNGAPSNEGRRFLSAALGVEHLILDLRFLIFDLRFAPSALGLHSESLCAFFAAFAVKRVRLNRKGAK